LSELGGDWSWLVSDEILEGTKGDVLSEEGGDDGTIGFLSELGSDWGWLVGDEVLESTKGNILTKEG
jgi:hypothetical protein